MKLINLFPRARKRVPHTSEIEAPVRLRNDLGNDLADRSSMAELVRLLKEADEALQDSGPQPA